MQSSDDVLRVVIGKDFSSAATDTGNVVCLELCPAATLQNHASIDDLVAEFERDDAGAMQEARKWVAKEFFGDEDETLAGLRRAAGFSQVELAERIGSTQPYVAKVEAGNTNLQLSTLRRLAEVLSVDMNTLDRALFVTTARNTE